MTMTYDEALAYLSPHDLTSDTASVSLTAGKMREAIAAITAVLPYIEMATQLLEQPKTHVLGQGEVLIYAGRLKSGEVVIRLRNDLHGLPIGNISKVSVCTKSIEPQDTLLVLANRSALNSLRTMLNLAGKSFDEIDPAGAADTADDAGTRLVQIMVNFIAKHEITCAETVHQADRVIVDATTLIEDLCNVVGYIKLGDED